MNRSGDTQRYFGSLDKRAVYLKYSRILDDPNTKRILFDSRQASLFNELNEPMDENQQRMLHIPFDQFYLEFTEPLVIGEQQPGMEHKDFVRAIIYYDDMAEIKIPFLQRENQQIDDSKMHRYKTGQLTFLLENSHGDLIDRTIQFNLNSGYAFTRPFICTGFEDPSEMPENWKDWPEESFIVAGRGIIGIDKNRYIGWWERTCVAYAQLFSWMLAYMMAKSIHIEAEPISRQQRRWHERKNIIPKPWHIVKVNPKFISKKTGEPAIGSRHSYRYDVIGHLRWGRHKRGDGSYSEAWEWVPAHQGGLANTVYIPATHSVTRGKIVAPAMKRYFRQGDKE